MPPSGHRKTEKQQQADLHRLQVKVDPGVPGEILSKESQAVSEEQRCLPAGCFSVGAGSLRPPRRKWLRTQHPLPGTSTPPPSPRQRRASGSGLHGEVLGAPRGSTLAPPSPRVPYLHRNALSLPILSDVAGTAWFIFIFLFLCH